ncbi:hypothetical protein D1872_287910 [compost metagenome]
MVHVPLRFFLVHDIGQQLAAFLAWHAFPDLQEILLARERKNRNRDRIRTISAEIDVAEAYVRLAITARRHAAFVAVADFALRIVV